MGLPMEQVVTRCDSCDIDLESGGNNLDSKVSNKQDAGGFNKTRPFVSNACDESVKCEARVTVSIAQDYSDLSFENVKLIVVDNKAVAGEKKGGVLGKKPVKGKPKAMSAKKPPKPPLGPRGQRGLSLDSTDQKLIRELGEIAKMKRERMERMKALMKAKEAKTSSSKSQLLATLFTIMFCIVILFQGISSRTNSAASLHLSPTTSGATGGGVISMASFPNMSATDANEPRSDNPSLVEPVHVNAKERARKAIG